MFKRKKQQGDERIVKETNRLTSKVMCLMVTLSIAMLITKIVCKLPVYLYALEILALVTCVLVVGIGEARKGILFMKNRDEAIQVIHEEIVAKAFMASFWEFIVGELVLWFMLLETAQKYLWWGISYFVIWIPCALIITIASLKNGWIIWGTKKKEETGKREFAKRTVISALLFGLITNIQAIYHHGAFHASGIGRALAAGALWGILFYFSMTILMKIAEKNANKNLEKRVGEVEKQENENCQN